MKLDIKGTNGFSITESNIFCWSKKKRVEVKMQKFLANFDDLGLTSLTPDQVATFMAKFNQNLLKSYKKEYAAWEKIIQKKLDTLEAFIISDEKTYINKAKKKTPLPSEVVTYVKMQNQGIKVTSDKIAADALVSYKKMISDIVEKVRSETLKKMSNIGKKTSLKQKVLMFWAAGVFLAVFVPMVIATAGVAGVALAAGILTGLTASYKLVQSCRDFTKNYDKAVIKASAKLTAAVDAVDEALEQMKNAEESYIAINMKLDEGLSNMSAAVNESKRGYQDKSVIDAGKKLDETMTAMKSFQSVMVDPRKAKDDLSKALKSVKSAENQMPAKSKSGKGSIVDIITEFGKAVGVLNG